MFKALIFIIKITKCLISISPYSLSLYIHIMIFSLLLYYYNKYLIYLLLYKRLKSNTCTYIFDMDVFVVIIQINLKNIIVL